MHSLQVEAYVAKILEREPHQLSEVEIVLLRLAAILHDIGRLEITDNHAQLGAEIVAEWLSRALCDSLTRQQKSSVLEMIAAHSNKGQAESNFSLAVLKDADTLDEIGVMSIFMCSNWIDKQSPFFFHDLRQRLLEFEIPFCEEKMEILNTKAAREILTEKRAFIENFIVQLENELEADQQIEPLLRNPRVNGS